MPQATGPAHALPYVCGRLGEPFARRRTAEDVGGGAAGQVLRAPTQKTAADGEENVELQVLVVGPTDVVGYGDDSPERTRPGMQQAPTSLTGRADRPIGCLSNMD